MRSLFSISIMLLAMQIASVAHANEKPVPIWLAELRTEALSQGISANLFDRAFKGFSPNSRIIELDRKQPEKTLSFQQYLDKVVNQTRINQGRKLYQKHYSLLNKIGNQYGVQPRFIVALWGIETNYGGNTGGFNIIPALATLAYDGRRSDFFRDELLKALKIVSANHIALDDFQGSWAGAMGQSQFMPSSFLSYAQDYNGDGRKDIWKTQSDVFASIANYLKNTGWEKDVTWGREVKLPANFAFELTGREIKKSLPQWSALGVTNPNGTALPNRPDIMASITYPGKDGEEAYLTYGNYDRIMKWNRSTYFATAVGTLADKIAR